MANLILFNFIPRFTKYAEPRFNIKTTSYQYRKSHCGDKTILRPSYLHNGISYTGKMTSLYWIRALNAGSIKLQNMGVCIKLFWFLYTPWKETSLSLTHWSLARLISILKIWFPRIFLTNIKSISNLFPTGLPTDSQNLLRSLLDVVMGNVANSIWYITSSMDNGLFITKAVGLLYISTHILGKWYSYCTRIKLIPTIL